MKQIVAHKKLSTLAGIGLVVGLVVVLILLNYLVIDVLAVRVGATAATIGFWVIGGALALLLLRVFVVRYNYETGAGVLRLTRSYGKRERFIEDIYTNRILFIGTPAEAAKKYPHARTVKALRPSDRLPVTAIAYKDSKGISIAHIQANEALLEEIGKMRGKG